MRKHVPAPNFSSTNTANIGPPKRGHIKKESLLGNPASTPFGGFASQAPPNAGFPQGMAGPPLGTSPRKRII